MKRFALLALIGLAGCFSTSSDGGDCFGLRRTEQSCVYQTSGVAGYECTKLQWVKFDFKRLPESQVVITCEPDDEASTIRILQPADVLCEFHFVEGCVQ